MKTYKKAPATVHYSENINRIEISSQLSDLIANFNNVELKINSETVRLQLIFLPVETENSITMTQLYTYASKYTFRIPESKRVEIADFFKLVYAKRLKPSLKYKKSCTKISSDSVVLEFGC